jgi:hypothetical protein
MSIKLCQHIRENGIFCQSAALRGRNYCYFHMRVLGRRMAMAKARARGEQWRLNLPPLEDMHAVQTALMQVLDAVADDRIDRRRAGLLLYGLQQASCNIKGVHSWIGPDRYEIDPENEKRAINYPDFEQEFSLPKRLDLSLPPEQAFPPPVEPPSVEEKLERAYYEAIVRAGTHDLRTPVSPDPTAPKARVPQVRPSIGLTWDATAKNGRAGLQAGVPGHQNDPGFSPNAATTQALYQSTASAVPTAAKMNTGASAPAAAPKLNPSPSSGRAALKRRVPLASSHPKRASAPGINPRATEPHLPNSWLKQAMKVIQQ